MACRKDGNKQKRGREWPIKKDSIYLCVDWSHEASPKSGCYTINIDMYQTIPIGMYQTIPIGMYQTIPIDMYQTIPIDMYQTSKYLTKICVH